MASCGIPSIDGLFAVPVGAPLRTGAPDRDAVGLIQDLLAGQGFTGMPEMTNVSRGVFGPAIWSKRRKVRAGNVGGATGGIGGSPAWNSVPGMSSACSSASE